MNSHSPFTLSDITVTFPNKTCFKDFSSHIYPGERIALIGDNGVGKSTLLRILAGATDKYMGTCVIPDDAVIGYVPQLLERDIHITVWEYLGQEHTGIVLLSQMGLADKKDVTLTTLSGGEFFLIALIQVLIAEPNVLLLDEPTNHLDADNRKRLFSFLHSWKGTAVIVSHDVELLRTWPTRIWDIRNQTIIETHGAYDTHIRECAIVEQQQIEHRASLQCEKRKLKVLRQKDIARESQSKKVGKRKYANAPKVVRRAKQEQASSTTGRKRHELAEKQKHSAQQLKKAYITKVITPHFNLSHKKSHQSLHIEHGTVGYGDIVLVHDINISVQPGERIALMGANGSGKTTLFKALLGDITVFKTGTWSIPSPHMIGYLDQHYTILNIAQTPFDLIRDMQPEWSDAAIRKVLNDFLFSTNESVFAPMYTLSGGECARLALACIVAQSPGVLLLDEITNNIDLKTRKHLIQVLKEYSGTLFIISHDIDFIQSIGVMRQVSIKNGKLIDSF